MALVSADPDAPDMVKAVLYMWALMNAIVMLFMQVGYALLEVGSVRVFHMKNVLIKNVANMSIFAAFFYAFGYAVFSDSGNSIIGNKYLFMQADASNGELLRIGAEWFMGVSLGLATVAIVSAAMTERCKLATYFTLSALLGGIIYPLVAHWVWSTEGWLSVYNQKRSINGVLGFMDYAGGSVVHVLGGTAAFIGVAVIGPRKGRFSPDGSVKELDGQVGNNSIYKATGGMILFVSYIAFNAGPTASSIQAAPSASLVGTNTIISSAFSCFLIASQLFVRRLEIPFMLVVDAMLAGCVGIAAGAPLMKPWAAMVVGCVSGALCELATELMVKLKLDDGVNAVAVHLLPGLWGVLSVGLFAHKDDIRMAYGPFVADASDSDFAVGLVYSGEARLFAVQALGVFTIITFITIIMVPIFLLLQTFNCLRLPVGQDLALPLPRRIASVETYNNAEKGVDSKLAKQSVSFQTPHGSYLTTSPMTPAVAPDAAEVPGPVQPEANPVAPRGPGVAQVHMPGSPARGVGNPMLANGQVHHMGQHFMAAPPDLGPGSPIPPAPGGSPAGRQVAWVPHDSVPQHGVPQRAPQYAQQQAPGHPVKHGHHHAPQYAVQHIPQHAAQVAMQHAQLHNPLYAGAPPRYTHDHGNGQAGWDAADVPPPLLSPLGPAPVLQSPTSGESGQDSVSSGSRGEEAWNKAARSRRPPAGPAYGTQQAVAPPKGPYGDWHRVSLDGDRSQVRGGSTGGYAASRDSS